jgi:hypothetical protein
LHVFTDIVLFQSAREPSDIHLSSCIL